MAELLVYNRQDYQVAFSVGDVVEAQDDGYWTGVNAKGFDHNAFFVIKIPANINAIKHLIGTKFSGNTILRRTSYKADMQQIIIPENKILILNGQQASEIMREIT